VGQRLTSPEQHVIRDLITEAQADGLTAQRACGVLGLSPRTLQRWQADDLAHPPEPGAAVSLAGAAPRVQRCHPYNALTAREAALVVALIRSPLHADASCRELALALEQGPSPLSVSHVTIWEYQCALNCNGPRGRQVGQGLHRTAPDTDWVNGPNQLWDWDITYLHSLERNVFFYLYSLLDHWSRKNIAWLIDAQLSSTCVQTLWDHGLISEGLLDQPASVWPKSLSDRGAQMRSHSTKAYFKKLSIEQLFSRPSTPDDNPFIESHFATIKTQPVFPGFFTDQPAAEDYFDQFYPWYNEVHPHTRLHMLTPNQMHTGQLARMLADRAALKVVTLTARETNRSTHTFTLEELIAQPLPDVSGYPVYTWAGPKTVPPKQATSLD
jgi:putative transposase